MKKKLGIILLALLLLALFMACDNATPTDVDDYEVYDPDDIYESDDEHLLSPEEVAIEVYNDIVQRFSFVDDNQPGAFDVDAIIKIDMDLLDYDISIVIDANFRIISDGHQTQMAIYTHTDMSDFGTPPIDADIYVAMEDDIIVDFVFFADGEDISDFAPVESIDDALADINNYPEFDESAIRSVDIDSVGDTTVINLWLYSDMLGEFISDTMEAYTTMLDSFGVELEADIADLLIIIEIDSEGNPLTMVFDMLTRLRFPDDLTGELEEFSGEEMHISMIVHYSYNAFDDVEIIWPEVGSPPAAEVPTTPELPETFPDPSSRTIIVPDDPAELDKLLEFLEAFDLDTVVITDNITGQQQLSVFPSVGSFERIEMFYTVTGIEIDPMDIMQSGNAIFIMYLEMSAEQRAEFLALVASS